jgi:molybdate-binding protein
VDAALALSAALGVEVTELFGPTAAAVDVASGAVPGDGSLVRTGRVGERTVTAPALVGDAGWDAADGRVEEGRVSYFGRLRPGIVVAGCEPGLEVLERLQREQGRAAVAATASTAAAVEALRTGRVHAAVVHGPAPETNPALQQVDVARYRLTTWRVGLAGAPGAPEGWWQPVLAGRSVVVQREPGAGVQQALVRAAATTAPLPGPQVGTHLEAARRTAINGLPAVTIEPAALALGVKFHPLETHRVELWIATEWLGDAMVTAALETIGGSRFQQRLSAIGGYDLSDSGTRIS